MRSLLDPRLRAVMPEAWPSFCRVQTISTTVDAANQPIPTTPTTVAGMSAIPCRVGPLIQVRPTDEETRDTSITMTTLHREVKLNGYFPTITPHTMNAVIDGVAYHIVGTDVDGCKFSTRLRVEIIRP